MNLAQETLGQFLDVFAVLFLNHFFVYGIVILVYFVDELDTVGVVTITGAPGKTTGSVGLVGGSVAAGSSAGRGRRCSVGRVRSVRAALPLGNALGAVAGALRTTVRVRRRGTRVVEVTVAVLLLGGPQSGGRIVADHVMPGRLDSGIIQGQHWRTLH